jgi:SAM-dependent methyltransferase
MAQWNAGAITDVAARPRFHREATPVWLSTACTLLGSRAPSLSRPFRFADIGCGQGFHAAVVAATCPGADVWGFDFNPANIEFGRDLAERAGLTNIRFLEVSFAEMAGMELPQFDFMIVEAVLSVVSAENQGHVHTAIGRHLRPGGLAYLGYVADTGWAEFSPLQTVMRMLYEAGTDTSDFAVSGILPYLDQLRARGAAYFQRNPVLDRCMAEVRSRSPIDLAHELLGRDWHPLMFADVADSMAEVKCDFLGRATLHENIAREAVPPGMAPLLDDAPSIRLRETMQDVAAATPYRRDIYRRGLNFMAVAEHIDRLGAITVAALTRDAPEASSWPGQNGGDLNRYQPLIEALRDGAISVATVRSLAGGSAEAAADAVAMLIAAGQAHPVMPPLVAREAAGAVARLNEVIIDAITRGEELDHLVSPVLGAAVLTNPLEALTIGALLYGVKPDDLNGLTSSVSRAMQVGGRTVTRDGAAVEDAGQAASVLRESIARIVEHRTPLFRGLGVLPQA